ncbi:DUF2070 family protein [Desulfurococcaceae archaeon MEX13E-LK6-19]|nr:DUF2070 family protein [Desulfurococcaceae archaeon MEX13E-LK6-19]
MGNRSSVQKYYRVLFSLPSKTVIMALIVLTSLVLYTILGVFFKVFVSLIILSALLLYLYGLVEKNPFSTVKRVLGYILFSLVLVLFPVLVVKELLGITSVSVVLASLSGLLSILIVGISGLNRKTITYVLVSSLFLALVVFMFIKSNVIIFVYGVIPALLSIGTAYYVARHKIRGIDVLSVGIGFLRYKLNGEKLIERIFSRLSVFKNIQAHIISTSNAAIIYTDIHYGPFGRIGSSDFPSILSSFLKEYKTLILHGMGSHDRNIALKEYAIKYAELISNAIRSKKGRECIPIDTFTVRVNEWEALVCLFSCMALVFLSRTNGGIDDLPYSIQEYAWRKSVEEGIQPIVVIDSHNSELTVEPDITSIFTLIDKVVDSIKRIKIQNLNYCVGVSSSKINNTPGVVNGEITLLTLKTGEKYTCILYIPGNNMEPGVREELIKEMTMQGCDIAEVITNDEHSETGVFSGEVYKPIQLSRELLEKTRELVKQSLDNCSQEQLYYNNIVFKAPLMGNSIWRLKWFLEKLFYKVMIIDFINVLFVPIALTLILPA